MRVCAGPIVVRVSLFFYVSVYALIVSIPTSSNFANPPMFSLEIKNVHHPPLQVSKNSVEGPLDP
jgi:hypothetical protein